MIHNISVPMDVELRRTASCLYFALCLVVCFYQFFCVFIEYLKYDVTTQLELRIPDPIVAPDLTICVRFTDIIDLKILGDKNNISLSRGFTASNIRQIQELSTIADILKLTPRKDSLIGECMFRVPRKASVEPESGDRCMKYFSMAKLVTQEFVCYKFSASSVKKGFDFVALTSALTWPGLFYRITLKNFSWISDVGVMKMAAHSKSDLPFTSLGLGSLVTSRRDNDNYNHVTLTYKTVDVTALESPYQTNCRKKLPDGSEYSKQSCFNSCILNHTQKVFQRAPFAILIQESLKLHQITSEQISNQSFSHTLAKLESHCSDRCPEIDCKFDYTITYSSFQKSKELQFLVTTPNEPTLYIKNMEQLTLNDLIYYSLSLFAFWFGLSVISFDPSPVILKHFSSHSKWMSGRRELHDEHDRSSKFCRNTRKNLLRGLRSELKYLRSDIFLRK